MHDPTLSDSPHLSGAQPTWGDLPYGCEILQAYWEADGQSKAEIDEHLKSIGEKSKINQLTSLFGIEKLGLINEDGTLTLHGVWIASAFDPPSQQGLDGDARLGSKEVLSQTEQALFGLLLFERDWLPMLATINLIAIETIPSTETEARAEEFQRRVEHLDGYDNVDSINSWKKKVQAHLSWALHLDLAYENPQETLELTGFGQHIHESVRSEYHPDWPDH